MATYEEVAELASELNLKLNSKFTADNLLHLINTYTIDPDFYEIDHIAEDIVELIMMSDAFVAAQEGDDVETIVELVGETESILS
jgi:hypothetical protein